MNRNGMISSTLLSKLAISLAVFTLLASAIMSYERMNKNTEEKKLKKILQTVSQTIRRADTLPGEVRLRKDLPTVSKNYKLAITKSSKRPNLLKARIVGGENISQSIYLNTELDNDQFRKSIENPQRLIVEKSTELSVEVF